ncbi:hypothetical protein HZ996_11415 [Cryomorphaceae bacterium]|nr:hypothetical protein HZ996_11415 [Cryomorphaceae bacterium]
MKKILLILMCACGAISASAQNPVKENLAWMVGDWNGSGWASQGPGSKVNFNQKEHIIWGAGETVLVIQGEGTDPESGETVFEAVGMIYYDIREQAYHMHSFTADQGGVIADFKVTGDRQAEWGFDVPGGSVIYRINATSGDWVEKGYFRPKGMPQEYPMFDMTVVRDETTD